MVADQSRISNRQKRQPFSNYPISLTTNSGLVFLCTTACFTVGMENPMFYLTFEDKRNSSKRNRRRGTLLRVMKRSGWPCCLAVIIYQACPRPESLRPHTRHGLPRNWLLFSSPHFVFCIS
jgi:hypothetical protein